jgi:hypothetical protein
MIISVGLEICLSPLFIPKQTQLRLHHQLPSSPPLLRPLAIPPNQSPRYVTFLFYLSLSPCLSLTCAGGGVIADIYVMPLRSCCPLG